MSFKSPYIYIAERLTQTGRGGSFWASIGAWTRKTDAVELCKTALSSDSADWRIKRIRQSDQKIDIIEPKDF